MLHGASFNIVTRVYSMIKLVDLVLSMMSLCDT